MRGHKTIGGYYQSYVRRLGTLDALHNNPIIPLGRIMTPSWGSHRPGTRLNFALKGFSEVRRFLGAISHIHLPHTGVCCPCFVAS